MRSVPEILAELEDGIRHVHKAPGMYGATAGEVEAVLWCLHYTWAMVQERAAEFRNVCDARLIELGTNRSLAVSYKDRHPNAKAGTVLRHVLTNWKLIAERLGIAV